MSAKDAFEDDQTAIVNLRIAVRKDAAARVMLAALQTTRLQLHAVLAGKKALSIEKQWSIVDAAIIQAEKAGI